MLKKKQSIKSNSEWQDAFENSVNIYSREYIANKEKATIEHIQRVCSKYHKVFSGWIAGKDSQVLQMIMEHSGVSFTPIMWKGINEWPAVKQFIEKEKPLNLITETIDKFDFEFLEKHPEYLFCNGKGVAQKWMSEKWKRYQKDQKKYGFDLLVLGRRIKDGNNCGDENYILHNGGGYDIFAPLADWNHEEMFAYIKYNGVKLSPFYSFPRGFLIGSIAMGEWTEYACKDKTIEQTWEEVYSIDKSVVENASKYLTSARDFLARRKM